MNEVYCGFFRTRALGNRLEAMIRASPAIAQDLHDVLGLNLTAVL